MSDLNGEPDRLIRLPEVLRMTGLGRATLFALVKARDFPRPVRLGARAVAWWYSEVLAWMRSRPIASESNWR